MEFIQNTTPTLNCDIQDNTISEESVETWHSRTVLFLDMAAHSGQSQTHSKWVSVDKTERKHCSLLRLTKPPNEE